MVQRELTVQSFVLDRIVRIGLQDRAVRTVLEPAELQAERHVVLRLRRDLATALVAELARGRAGLGAGRQGERSAGHFGVRGARRPCRVPWLPGTCWPSSALHRHRRPSSPRGRPRAHRPQPHESYACYPLFVFVRGSREHVPMISVCGIANRVPKRFPATHSRGSIERDAQRSVKCECPPGRNFFASAAPEAALRQKDLSPDTSNDLCSSTPSTLRIASIRG